MADQSEDIDRMHAIWKERGLPKITEHRLCDQARRSERMSGLLLSSWMKSGEE